MVFYDAEKEVDKGGQTRAEESFRVLLDKDGTLFDDLRNCSNSNRNSPTSYASHSIRSPTSETEYASTTSCREWSSLRLFSRWRKSLLSLRIRANCSALRRKSPHWSPRFTIGTNLEIPYFSVILMIMDAPVPSPEDRSNGGEGRRMKGKLGRVCGNFGSGVIIGAICMVELSSILSVIDTEAFLTLLPTEICWENS